MTAKIWIVDSRGADYRCPKCGKVVWRNSDKAWIRSWCEKTGKDQRLMRIGGKP